VLVLVLGVGVGVGVRVGVGGVCYFCVVVFDVVTVRNVNLLFVATCRSINCLKIDCRRKNNVLNEIKSRQFNSTSYPKSRVLRIHSKFGHQACWIDWPTKYIEYNRKWGFRSRYPVFKAVKNGGQFSSKVVFWHTTMGEIFLFKSRSTIYTSHLDFKLK
jgi:hypothetical protein